MDDSTVFAMINYTLAWNVGLFTSTSQSLASGSRYMMGSQFWEIDYANACNTATPTTTRPLNFQGSHVPATDTQTFVAITAVPEPSTQPGANGVVELWPKCNIGKRRDAAMGGYSSKAVSSDGQQADCRSRGGCRRPGHRA